MSSKRKEGSKSHGRGRQKFSWQEYWRRHYVSHCRQQLKLTIDTAIEIYQYGLSKKSGSRNTLFVLSDKHKDLSVLKKALRKEYGLTTDARRYQIGDFNIEIGVTCSEKAYMANTQTEWQNLRTRFLQWHRPILSPRWVKRECKLLIISWSPVNKYVKMEQLSHCRYAGYPSKDLKIQIASNKLSWSKLEKKINPNAAVVICTKYLTSCAFNSLGERP